MEWFTISINPPEINKGQDLIFRRKYKSSVSHSYEIVTTDKQSIYQDFDEMYDYCGISHGMTEWAVLTDYSGGNNDE